MSDGVKVLLEAAQFIEQQEKLKLSPQSSTATATIFTNGGDHHHHHHHIDHCGNETNNNNISIVSNNNNNNNSIDIHNSKNNFLITTTTRNQRHTTSVSSSAPAFMATFQHATTTANATATTTTNNNKINNNNLTNGLTLSAASVAAITNAIATSTGGKSQLLATRCTENEFSRSSDGRMSEDEFSSNSLSPNSNSSSSTTTTTTTTTNNNNNTINNNNNNHTGFILLPVTINKAHEQQQQQHEQAPSHFTAIDNQTEMEIDVVGDDSPSPIAITNSNNNTKQFLVNGGVIVGAGGGIASRPINMNGAVAVAAAAKQTLGTATAASFSLPNTSSSMFSLLSQHQNSQNSLNGHENGSMATATVTISNKCPPRYKSTIPLTPPPTSSRKFSETSTRIRSFSLSSHKIPASQLMLHHGNGNGNGMIIDDATVGQHMSYAASTSSNSNHSPPRYHYTVGSQQATTSGRRRTISSNSNGAGNRETHNKLEKNRRAHLKECYEALKNELPLKEEERKKTSNLAILGEAYKYVTVLKKQDRDVEADVERVAKEKINLQKRWNILRREIGTKYNKLCGGMIIDTTADMPSTSSGRSTNSIPNDREMSDSTSLSSARGSVHFGSSSSLSSGGSTALSSPIGGAMPATASATATTTTAAAIAAVASSSPVILKSLNGPPGSATITTTSPISPSMLQQLKAIGTTATDITHASVGAGAGASSGTGATTTTTAIMINKSQKAIGGGVGVGGSSPIVVTTLPLSLTAKNITATSLTRGSPTPTAQSTPSTPSPSPSSSSTSGVSSSSSSASATLISSSPPINGIISGIGGRTVIGGSSSGGIIGAGGPTTTVTVNIPNGLKLQTSGGATIGTIGNGTTSASATIIATSAPGAAMAAGNNAAHPPLHHQHHKHQLPVASVASVAAVKAIAPTTASSTVVTAVVKPTAAAASVDTNNVKNTNIATNGYRYTYGRKRSVSNLDDVATNGNSNNNSIKHQNNNNNNIFTINNNNHQRAITTTTTTTATAINGKTINGFQGLQSNATTMATIASAATVHQQQSPQNSAKFIKVYNGNNNNKSNTINHTPLATIHATNAVTNGLTTQLHLHQVMNGGSGGGNCGGGSLLVNTSMAAHKPSQPPTTTTTTQVQKFILNGCSIVGEAGNSVNTTANAGELGRLPGGAELNILPSSNGGSSSANGNIPPPIGSTGLAVTAAFYQANGKLTLVNATTAAAAAAKNGLALKERSSVAGSASIAPFIVTSGDAAVGSPVTSLHVNGTRGGASGSLHYAANFAQFVAAANKNNNNNNNKNHLASGSAGLERLKGKIAGS